MQQTSRKIGLGVVAVGAIVAFGFTETASADNSTIRLTSHATSVNDFVDIGASGPSPGDVYVFQDTLKDLDGNEVGHAEGRCNLIVPAQALLECTIVSTLPDGTITTDGMLTNVTGSKSVGAITGGTGKYRNAAGQGTIVLGETTHSVTFEVTR